MFWYVLDVLSCFCLPRATFPFATAKERIPANRFRERPDDDDEDEDEVDEVGEEF